MEELPANNFSSKKKIIFIIGAILFVCIFYYLFFSAPFGFPVGSIVSIDEGMNLRSVSLKLKNEHVISSRTIFEAFMILYGGEKHLVSSDYLLDGKLPAFEVARRMAHGESHLAPIKVVVPEGFDDTQISDAFSLKLSHFDRIKFLLQAKQGYLFPDTYFFFTMSDEADVLKSMGDNYARKILPFKAEIQATGKSEADIIKMASVIEREAKGPDSDVISGILWRRIKLGIPLQVDAAPETYKVRGLPAEPICNPGIESLKAALSPQNSPYLYYLHDKDGNIHYAKTFEEHKANKLKYLHK